MTDWIHTKMAGAAVMTLGLLLIVALLGVIGAVPAGGWWLVVALVLIAGLCILGMEAEWRAGNPVGPVVPAPATNRPITIGSAGRPGSPDPGLLSGSANHNSIG